MANEKDYNILAKTLSKAIDQNTKTDVERDIVMNIARNLADEFKANNKNFDRRKFMNTVATDYKYL